MRGANGIGHSKIKKRFISFFVHERLTSTVEGKKGKWPDRQCLKKAGVGQRRSRNGEVTKGKKKSHNKEKKGKRGQSAKT